jgi:predicted 2-oxoglutarate/Fe(II)-dependent dioxygenase YbiX
MRSVLTTIPGFMSPAECEATIADVERRGFTEAPITTSGGFVMAPEIRNNMRVIVDKHDLAARLWDRLKPHVEERVDEEWQALGLNERFRFYRYDPGQAFRWHRDGAFIRNDDERSFLTFMVYLNAGFEGGATEFPDTAVEPDAGLAVVFAHYLRHQGAEVVRGRKYVLRSDVMYRRARSE